MTSAVDSTRILRDAAQHAFLRGERQKAFDLYRCDPCVGVHVELHQWQTSFARAIVCGHSREFVEGLLRTSRVERLHDVMHCLDRMDGTDTMTLEYALLRAGPHTVSAEMAAEVVLRIMGRL